MRVEEQPQRSSVADCPRRTLTWRAFPGQANAAAWAASDHACGAPLAPPQKANRVCRAKGVVDWWRGCPGSASSGPALFPGPGVRSVLARGCGLWMLSILVVDTPPSVPVISSHVPGFRAISLPGASSPEDPIAKGAAKDPKHERGRGSRITDAESAQCSAPSRAGGRSVTPVHQTAERRLSVPTDNSAPPPAPPAVDEADSSFSSCEARTTHPVPTYSYKYMEPQALAKPADLGLGSFHCTVHCSLRPAANNHAVAGAVGAL
ncbi:hypothetical protein VFPBJ_05956 [Purpureocillium lilacinum]|uniref:Uncharacterized protein n=1 Tax=Purpureocillium lilacinum TaxID=33203 RepID=A0A179GSV6_PURLI|nr:hypothetical protein VFPBJ_05956 [Purpureocillium lilacinum]